MKYTAVVEFQIPQRNFSVDLEIPLDLSAWELLKALNEVFHLGISSADDPKACLQAEYPMTLLRGNRSLAKSGIRTGSILAFTG